MATKSPQHECPLCGSSLSREVYERVLRIDEARKEHLTEAQDALNAERRNLRLERQRIAVEAAAAAKKVEAKARKEEHRLQEQVAHLRKELLQKSTAVAQEKQKIERAAAQKATDRLSAQMRKVEDELQRSEERRQREGDGWKKKIDELQRRAEARDRMHFGPEGEDQLEALLRRQFPKDDIERRGRGGDILHIVMDKDNECGKIVYECKRTATWQVAFIRQIKRDMERHGTRWGILVSRAFPSRYSGLCVVDGVIVAAPHVAPQLAHVLRDSVIELNRSNLSQSGKDAKTQEILRYLRSEEFLSAMQTVADRIKELRTSLEREKSSHEGWWDTREQHYAAIGRQTSSVNSRIRDILTTTTATTKRHLALTS